jgi:5-oxoprolinase (ATP-hydrolysing) subunit A
VSGDRAHRVDLNGDVGEQIGRDADLIPLLTSINVACGVHAGDAATMHETVIAGRRHGIAVGAHPSYPDRVHFGRRVMSLTDVEVEQCVLSQLSALAEIAAREGVRVTHVKPHGALYNVSARDGSVAAAIARAVAAFDRSLLVVGLAGSESIRAAARAGLGTANEAFADRAYHGDGTLVARDTPGAIIHDPLVIVPRAVRMVRAGLVTAIDGNDISVRADTICVHGDTLDAPVLAAALRAGLIDAGVEIAALSTSHL